MSNLRDLVQSNSPNTNLVALTSNYEAAISDFKRYADKLNTMLNNGAIAPPSVDASSPETIQAICDFIRWTRTYTEEQWKQGVPLTSKQVGEVAGRNGTPLDEARRACLVVKNPAVRRKGISATYSLSKPHMHGLAAVLVANTAIVAGTVARVIERDQERLLFQDRLHATLNPAAYQQADDALIEDESYEPLLLKDGGAQ